MPPTKLSALDAEVTLEGEDLLYVVTEPDGIPTSKRVPLSTLIAFLEGSYALDEFEGRWPSGTYLGDEGAYTTGSALVADRLIYWPVWVPVARTVDQITIDLTASGAGGTPTIRTGLYSPDGNGRPGALLADFGTVDASVAPGLLTKTVSQAVPRGLHWRGIVAQGATTTQPSVRQINNYRSRFVNHTAIISAGNRTIFQSGVSGALPANATPIVTSSTSTWTFDMRAA